MSCPCFCLRLIPPLVCNPHLLSPSHGPHTSSYLLSPELIDFSLLTGSFLVTTCCNISHLKKERNPPLIPYCSSVCSASPFLPFYGQGLWKMNLICRYSLSPFFPSWFLSNPLQPFSSPPTHPSRHSTTAVVMDLLIWPHLVAREAGKCHPPVSSWKGKSDLGTDRVMQRRKRGPFQSCYL